MSDSIGRTGHARRFDTKQGGTRPFVTTAAVLVALLSGAVAATLVRAEPAADAIQVSEVAQAR